MAGSQLDFLHASCVCGKSLTVDHCLSCSHGGYTIMRHNELRDITADLLQEVCSDVQVEPPLQPLSGEHLSLRTANREDGARLDVAATNFWSHNRQRTFFDVRVFNPLAQSNNQPLPTCYRKQEQEKRRHYDQRVREVGNRPVLSLCHPANQMQTNILLASVLRSTITNMPLRISVIIKTHPSHEHYCRPCSN